ncbi:rhomboid family intramembrane serine protease [Enterococcus florum]|uniref:Rhomboid family intramembrane serine protease n=1 Tax=Enterococcus florum TaxID=2480627 RepID=A0A4P5P3X9_9ENTE|nr:rhomboid family intramembrane serine protease [Enterococcus florum]GCF92300.1 rhomboid family intramembrane serine protease [Enterococcus florum]
MRKEKPYVTYAILAVNSIVFLMQYLLPEIMIENELGMFAPSVVYQQEYWRFLTPMLIHFGLAHFALNSVVLYYMGQQCEAIFGQWRFALLYFLSGLMGNLASFAFNHPNTLSGGASTAIFGLFGGFLVIGYHYRDNRAFQALTKQFGMFILLNLVFGVFDTSIDLWGHLGGLLGGALAGMILAVPHAEDRFSTRERITGVLFFLFFFVIAILLGFRKLGLPIL